MEESDHDVARRLAVGASELLVTLTEEPTRNRSGWWLEESGDANAHRFLLEQLAESRPHDAVLSEEGNDDLARLGASRTWIIDPLDGSSGFGQRNGEWAVHVALTIDGEIAAGAVAAPGLDCTATTGNPLVVEKPASNKLVIAMGRSRAWSDGRALSAELDADVLVCGSAGLKALLVMTGQAHCYVHDGPLYEWDVCAPVAVARSSGLVADTLGGETMVFNKRRPVVSGLIIGDSSAVSDVRTVFGY